MANETTALDEMKVADLREKAKDAGVTGTSHMKKDELVAALGDGASPAAADAPPQSGDAIALLTSDHRNVEQLFKAALEDDVEAEERQALAQQIVTELKLHTQIEEEIFYPALKAEAIEKDEDDAKDEVLEAYIEHGSVKELIAKIEALDPSDESYKAVLQVMSEQVGHHVEEEESEMFDQARELLDAAALEELGQQMAALKASVARTK